MKKKFKAAPPFTLTPVGRLWPPAASASGSLHGATRLVRPSVGLLDFQCWLSIYSPSVGRCWRATRSNGGKGRGSPVESRQPLAALVFIAPLLIIYEAGVILLGVQNGADAFMRRVLDIFGLGQHLVLPMLTVCILLGWQYLSRLPWRVSAGVVTTMAVESVLLGLCLRLVPFLQNCVLAAIDPPAPAGLYEKIQHAVGFIGAGIYEELLFRLILLSLLLWGLRWTGMKPRIAAVAAVLLGSLIFAAAHHVGPAGLPFQPFDFLFRTVAGGFFSIVFIYRGFGIAAGCHAAYDIMAGVF